MVRRGVLVGIGLLLLSSAIGCGIPQKEYDTAVAERDAATNQVTSLQAQLQSAESELSTVKSQYQSLFGEIDTAKSQLQSAQSELDKVKTELQAKQTDLSSTASSASSLAKKVALVKQVLIFESAILQLARAMKEGNEEEKKKQELLALSAFKSFDPLVKNVADTELSQSWGAAWPLGAQERSEKEQRLVYSFKDFAEFLERLSVSLEDDVKKLQTALIK